VKRVARDTLGRRQMRGRKAGGNEMWEKGGEESRGRKTEKILWEGEGADFSKGCKKGR